MLKKLWRDHVAPRLAERLAPRVAEHMMHEFSSRIAEAEISPRLEAFVGSRISEALAQKPWMRNMFIPAIEACQARANEPFMRFSTCSSHDFFHPQFTAIANDMAHPVWFHRKLWEWVFIIDAARRHGLTRPGVRALGFGVGTERIPATLAKYGADVMGTDAPESVGVEAGWVATDQFAKSIDTLFMHGILDRETFLKRVSLAECDMANIDPRLQDYDFCWSSSCLEHLGDLQAGIDFIINSVEKTLRIGGVACHTTEFNVSSNDRTIEKGSTVLYRRRDIEQLIATLRDRGHVVDDFIVAPSDHPLDSFVDTPPYQHAFHLKIDHAGHTVTSLGLVIRRGR